MLRQEKGFTMVELLVAMVVFLFAMAAATSTFLPLVNQFKQQGKIAETQMEGIIGIDLLRIDIENAGYGLPWYVWDEDTNYKQDWTGITYTEAEDEGDAAKLYHLYNDGGAVSPRAPRGIVMGNNVGTAANLMGVNNSDYLVIKATNVRMADEMQKWSYIRNDAGVVQPPHVWGNPQRDFDPGDKTKVIALRPSFAKDAFNILMTTSPPAPTYYAAISSFKTSPPATQIIPFETKETIVIYAVGLESDTDLRMPFNRADYYISTTNTPDRCAEGTGVLIKTVISHDDGTRGAGIPLLDCVADMQIILGLDMNDDGTVGTYTDYDPVLVTGSMVPAPANPDNPAPTLADVQDTLTDAERLRDRLKEVRVYILAHEGQRDPGFNFGANTIDVGEFSLGHSAPFAFALFNLPDHEYYRWKVYTMVLAPDNLKPKHEED
jgi:prepilin-type N-terminal cleavage/methylation domain-containing protein